MFGKLQGYFRGSDLYFTEYGKVAYKVCMKIHFIGDRGVSMRALKSMAEARGNTVSGSDRQSGGHKPENVEGCDLVVYTNAVRDDNCELLRARELGIPTIERAAYLGELSRAHTVTVAVAGCHGKSTTAAMLGEVFPRRDTTVHVGVAGASRVGGSKYFVTEACEYNRSFLHLTPDVGVILNIQYDHPDCYRSTEELVNAYAEFCAVSRATLINGDDRLCEGIHPKPLLFGLGTTCDYRADDIVNSNGFRVFTYKPRGGSAMRIELSVAGEHNVYNALATLAVADIAGLKLGEAKQALEGFCGLPRRFERRGLAYGKAVIVDYAHHPAEIAATINTAREMFPSVAVVFQPHTYSRTAAMLDDFAAALEKADEVMLAPVFAARETPTESGSSERLADKLGARTVGVLDPDGIIERVKALPQKAVIFMGAGDVDKLADRFIDEYNKSEK